ncbi:hypothetical protein Ahy_B04g072814 [Arachis hypogaea]|uniref:FAR1 domain-containing protein n=1 Tax=Arachis hypogaea TaxID=3818 RepID=A0A444ZNU9_ARAHY|nr:hypothetical protein Ahy_B04g072814 [Arachis hypogaea]
MTFNTLEDAAKFYKDYSKSSEHNKKENEIKNQLITYSREGNGYRKYLQLRRQIPQLAGLNCLARIYIHILKDISIWIISKVVLHHSHPCCANQAEMLKQHRKLSMSVRRTIENNEKVGIRPSKTY